mmetsp:Transcript_38909/g.69602  ORF Transcript_38909/g.69602 Transcript_38909/m.69602 type:complete len:89 (-) Transcript_38909:96-362(-)
MCGTSWIAVSNFQALSLISRPFTGMKASLDGRSFVFAITSLKAVATAFKCEATENPGPFFLAWEAGFECYVPNVPYAVWDGPFPKGQA